MSKRITVYCASSDKVDPKYFKSTIAIAHILTEANIGAVFGGGDKGLMGQLATTVVENGGKITGIMPHFMREVEWQHKHVQDFIFVEDMAERKKLLMKDVDALLALPGGSGKLEELLEAITLKRLGKFTKPIIIFNQDGYYDPLILMLERCIDEKFMRPEHKEIWSIITEPSQLLPAIEGAADWDESAIKFAAV